MISTEEQWKDIDGYEGLYQVSNYGRIKSLMGWNGHYYVRRERILSPTKQFENRFYSRAIVNLYKKGKGKTYKVHRLVAKAFIDNPNGFNIINHKDGNPLNNHYTNLEWCTQEHNVRHAVKNGLKVDRINTIDRQTMVELLNSNFNYDEISDILGVSKGTVFNYIKKFGIEKFYA